MPVCSIATHASVSSGCCASGSQAAGSSRAISTHASVSSSSASSAVQTGDSSVLAGSTHASASGSGSSAHSVSNSGSAFFSPHLETSCFALVRWISVLITATQFCPVAAQSGTIIPLPCSHPDRLLKAAGSVLNRRPPHSAASIGSVLHRPKSVQSASWIN